MNTYPQLPAGRPEREVGFSREVHGEANTREEVTLLGIQQDILQKACDFVAKVDDINPFNMVFTDGFNGEIARVAILRFLGLMDIPKSALYLQGVRIGQDELIRQSIESYSSNRSFQEGVRASKGILASLTPFIVSSKELKATNQHGQIQLGIYWFPVDYVKYELEKDPTGLSFMQTLRLRGLNTDQDQGLSMIADMYTGAHTFFTDMELDKIVRVRRYDAYYVNEVFLKQVDDLITKLKPPEPDLQMEDPKLFSKLTL
ncbi:MAG: hypothetical protein Q8P92_03295 [Candidatus Daviesbacteria bacterium]|nr:hypothetical protein [Candidatus Daviesbacteria bacterium]